VNASLERLDARLEAIERTTSLLGLTEGASSRAFYAHLVEGADPLLLLSDLKGQIDLLTWQVSQQRR
jgi:hypothetical protein